MVLQAEIYLFNRTLRTQNETSLAKCWWDVKRALNPKGIHDPSKSYTCCCNSSCCTGTNPARTLARQPSDLVGSFGIHANEPMQSWFVHRVSLSLLLVSSLLLSLVLSSVYSCPSDSIAHRNCISCRYMYIYLQYMHMKYWVNMTYTLEMAAILPKFLMWLSCLYG